MFSSPIEFKLTPFALAAILFCSSCLCNGGDAAAIEPENQPNFIFILADDLGWADLGYRDSDGFYETPNLDLFAAQNLDFDNAYSVAPLCTPTRASLYTGKFPARLGLDRAIAHQPGHAFKPQEPRLAPSARPELPFRQLNLYTNRNYLPLEEITFAEVFKDAGYVTGLMGKWHLGAEEYAPSNQGFDVVFGGHSGGNLGRYFYPYTFTDKGETGEYLSDRISYEAVEFIEDYAAQPFCLVVSHFSVHTPIEAKADKVAYFKKKAEGLGVTEKDPTYAAMISHLDDAFGRILEAVEKENIADRTVIIFTSDNGGMVLRGFEMRPNTENTPLSGGGNDS